MDELEDIKQRRLQAMQQQAEEHAQLEQQIDQLETMVKSKFTKEALQRFGNVKTAHPEKAVQVLLVLGQALQNKHVEVIDDTILKQLLSNLNEKKDIKIMRK